MIQTSEDLTFSTQGEVQVLDLTDQVTKVVGSSGVGTGQALVFTTSSTSAITTLEYEPGLVEEDLPGALERLFPKHGQGVHYGHQERWRDGNGHSHVRAAFLGPDLTVPVRQGRPVLGTWEQIVFVELDNKPRERRVVVNVWGSEA
ncbi:MAG: secondary thiamine-phosphate synthase enzyme YjbQ [Candidatus Thermoplasmatota archaeon]|nr:secondary thiamine-phosphate synthase enzyme YjbQ [Candidatus Thermoplasmatota archaeon]